MGRESFKTFLRVTVAAGREKGFEASPRRLLVHIFQEYSVVKSHDGGLEVGPCGLGEARRCYARIDRTGFGHPGHDCGRLLFLRAQAVGLSP